jgi:hypothetical protein
MQKHTYRVEFRGEPITRTTNRKYFFVTVSTGLAPAAKAKELAREAGYQDELAATYLAVLEGRRDGSGTRMYNMSERESYQLWYERALARAAHYRALDPVVESERRITDWGWSSRRDLAERNAAKARELGYQNVTILEVPQP